MINGYYSLSGECKCNDGYVWNSDKTSCNRINTTNIRQEEAVSGSVSSSDRNNLDLNNEKETDNSLDNININYQKEIIPAETKYGAGTIFWTIIICTAPLIVLVFIYRKVFK
jgi:hypothetical protein